MRFKKKITAIYAYIVIVKIQTFQILYIFLSQNLFSPSVSSQEIADKNLLNVLSNIPNVSERSFISVCVCVCSVCTHA